MHLEHLESRVLPSAGSIDPTYTPPFNNAHAVTFTQMVGMQIDAKSIHYTHFKKDTLWRQNSDGSLDRSFGSAGKVILPDLVQDIGIAPDGKIVVLYYHSAPKHIHLAALMPAAGPIEASAAAAMSTLPFTAKSFHLI